MGDLAADVARRMPDINEPRGVMRIGEYYDRCAGNQVAVGVERLP